MRQHVNAACRRVREALQSLHDESRTPPWDIAAHLETCPECAAFQRFLTGLPRDLQDTLDRSAAGMPAAGYARVFNQPSPARRSVKRIAIPVIAAGIAAAIAVPTGIFSVSALREKAAMREAVGSFVEGLFQAPAEKYAVITPGNHASTSQALDSLLNDLAESQTDSRPASPAAP